MRDRIGEAEWPAIAQKVPVKDRFVDLAMRIGILPDSGLVARRFAQNTRIACAVPSYLEERGQARPEALGNFDRLAFNQATSAGDWSFTDEAGRTFKVEGPVRFRADDVDVLLGAALAGAGIVYGPAFVLGPMSPVARWSKCCSTARPKAPASMSSVHRLTWWVPRFADSLV